MTPYSSTINRGRHGEITTMTVSFQENRMQVHFRLNRFGISSYKNTPRRMSDYDGVGGMTEAEILFARQTAVAYVKAMTGKDFNRAYERNLQAKAVTA